MAIKYYGGQLALGTNAERTGGTWTGAPTGYRFFETDTGKMFYWNGSAFTEQVVSTSVLSGTLAITSGGTGQTTATTAFDALSPMTTAGDIITGGASGTRTRLALGSANLPLKVNSGGTAVEYGVLPIAGGGTSGATATAGFDALSPMTTAGDIIIGGASGTRTRLAIGTANQLLRTNAGETAPEWASTLSGLTLTTPILTTPTINGIRGGDVGITSANNPYTALATTRIIRVDASSGAVTINLPTAASIAGHEYHIFRTDVASSTNLVTIDANSTETIDSNLTYILYTGEFVKLESDGTNWQVIARPSPSRYGYYLCKNSTNNRRYLAESGVHASLATSTSSPAANTLWAMPFIVPRTTQFDLISFRVTTLSSGAARAGIYRDDGNCYPGALVFDTGSIDTSTGSTAVTRDTTITASLQIFYPGLYWLAWETNSATGQYTTLNAAANLVGILGHENTLSTAATIYGYSVAHTYGTLPDPYTGSATGLNTTPSATNPVVAVGLRPV